MFSAIVIFAMEICGMSANPKECTAWMNDCMITILIKSAEFEIDNAGEVCAETLPEWALEGM